MKLGLLVVTVAIIGCDPANELRLHNAGDDPLEVSLTFPDDSPARRDVERVRLAPGSHADVYAGWGRKDWYEFAWSGAKHQGRDRFTPDQMSPTSRDVYVTPGGVRFGPRNGFEALDDRLGAMKMPLAAGVAIAVGFALRRRAKM